jgi:hypothetical protein
MNKEQRRATGYELVHSYRQLLKLHRNLLPPYSYPENVGDIFIPKHRYYLQEQSVITLQIKIEVLTAVQMWSAG